MGLSRGDHRLQLYGLCLGQERGGGRSHATTPHTPGRTATTSASGAATAAKSATPTCTTRATRTPAARPTASSLGLGPRRAWWRTTSPSTTTSRWPSIASGGGNVIAYNYVDNAVLWNSPGWQESAIDDSHGAFTHNDLIEGNWSPNIGSDTTHGNSAGIPTSGTTPTVGLAGNVTANVPAASTPGTTTARSSALLPGRQRGRHQIPLRRAMANPSTSFGNNFLVVQLGQWIRRVAQPTGTATGTR